MIEWNYLSIRVKIIVSRRAKPKPFLPLQNSGEDYLCVFLYVHVACLQALICVCIISYSYRNFSTDYEDITHLCFGWTGEQIKLSGGDYKSAEILFLAQIRITITHKFFLKM